MSMLPAAISCRCGFQKCVRAFSTSVMCALPRLPSLWPSRVTSSSPPAPPPTTTMRCSPCWLLLLSAKSSGDAAEPPQAQARGEHREHRAERGEQRGDLGLALFHHQLARQALVDLLQVFGGASVEVLAARQQRHLLERLFVEPH